MTRRNESPPGPPAPVQRLDRAFFDRPTRQVACALLGTLLWVRSGRSIGAVRLVETEAYVAHDPANHAFRGRTARNRSMFGPPGTLYVYRIHQVVCANLVTRPGEAVLLRAGAPVAGGLTNPSGPGRLCRSLGIEHRHDGVDVTRSPSVFLTPRAGRTSPIVRGPRVGIRRATELPLRFALAGEPWVSRPKPWRTART